MKRYKTYFVNCRENGDGVHIHTDLNYDLILDDIFINPETGTLLINYYFRGKPDNTRTLCEIEFNEIQIEEMDSVNVSIDDKSFNNISGSNISI